MSIIYSPAGYLPTRSNPLSCTPAAPRGKVVVLAVLELVSTCEVSVVVLDWSMFESERERATVSCIRRFRTRKTGAFLAFWSFPTLLIVLRTNHDTVPLVNSYYHTIEMRARGQRNGLVEGVEMASSGVPEMCVQDRNEKRGSQLFVTPNGLMSPRNDPPHYLICS